MKQPEQSLIPASNECQTAIEQKQSAQQQVVIEAKGKADTTVAATVR